MPPPDPGAELADLAELGDLFEKHRPRLVAVARGRLDDRLAAATGPEDVVSAAYLDASRKWPAYRAADPRPVSEFVWLYQLVVDRVVETWRAATRGKRDVRRNAAWPERPSIDLGLRLVAGGPGPGTRVAKAEAAALMKQALAGLKAADREVIQLRAYEELDFGEIGELLGLAENAATARYVRALRRLKDAWQALTGESRP